MAPYRRRPRWIYSRRRRRRNYYYPRWRRRYFRRRRRRPFRKVRVHRRRKKLATFWDPTNKASCKIKGWDIGLFARNSEACQRMWRTKFTSRAIVKQMEGGGVSLKTFDLAYLYKQHRYFHNVWTHTNDGFDLARYFGTKVYLKPHPTFDYVFFWDTDIKEEKPFDILRMHPAILLTSKNTIFVRSQIAGGNHKTKKVKIKPPANILNKWARQELWTDVPLFQYGFCLINWKDPFFRQTNQPIPIIQNPTPNKIWYTENGSFWNASTLYYSPYVDSGKGNMVGVKWVGPDHGDVQPTDFSKIVWIQWTFDLPYWMTLFGQNKLMDFNTTAEKEADQTVTQVFIKWPLWTPATILDGPTPSSGYKVWGGSYAEFKPIACCGPFVQPVYTPDNRINIPFIYESYWQWGGTQLVQQPINAIMPTSNQISVKNPASQFRSLIYPWDLSGGLLTDAAQERLTKEGSVTDERRPVPFEERPTGYAYPASSESESEETQTSEEEQDEIGSQSKTTRKIRQYFQRERNKRHKLKSFIRSMVKSQHFM
nr:ORF1 [Torque teno felis virus]